MLLIQAFLVTMVLVALVTDLLEQKIYNLLTLPTIVVGILIHLGTRYWWEGIGAALIVGVPFYLLYMFRVMKPGDVKMLMAVAAVGGIAIGIEVAVAAVVLNGVIATITLLAYRRMGDVLRAFTPGWSPDKSHWSPFGGAIALATLAALALQDLPR
jgi:Flp pilus assembly protein protease CpaA